MGSGVSPLHQWLIHLVRTNLPESQVKKVSIRRRDTVVMRLAFYAVVPFFLAVACIGLSYTETPQGVHQFPIVEVLSNPSESVRSAYATQHVTLTYYDLRSLV